MWIANHNSPHQTVLAGNRGRARRSRRRSFRPPASAPSASRSRAASTRRSSPAPRNRWPRRSRKLSFAAPRMPVYSNTTAAPHAPEPAAIAKQLAEHLVSPVQVRGRDRGDVRGRRAGVRRGRPAGGADRADRADPCRPAAPGGRVRREIASRVWCSLPHLLGQLLAAGVPGSTSTGCSRVAACKPSTWRSSGRKPASRNTRATAWVVNGVRSRPINGPEPRLARPSAPARAPASERRSPPPLRPAQPKAEQEPTYSCHCSQTTHSHPNSSDAHSSRDPASEDEQHRDYTRSVDSVRQWARPHAAARTRRRRAVMMRFQDVMARFLDTQRSVMLSFLGSGGPPGAIRQWPRDVPGRTGQCQRHRASRRSGSRGGEPARRTAESVPRPSPRRRHNP